MLDGWLQDLRYALRVLAKSPLFALTATLSLAIGIGANSTIFSIASALLLRPLPGLVAPDRLVDIGRTQGGSGFDTTSYPNYRDLRERTRTLQDVYAYRLEPQPMSLGGETEAERIYGLLVTANYFTALGTVPAAGRLLTDEDDRNAPGQSVIVISYHLWQRRFSADPNIAGRVITVNGHPFTIVGVAPRGFQGTSLMRPDAWTPLSALTAAAPRTSQTMMTSRRAVWLGMGARLAPGVTCEQALAEVTAIGANLQREYPVDNEGKGFTLLPAAIFPGYTSYIAAFMGLLMGIVGLVLLIACVNLAGMLLARAADRRREVAIRLAIGAGRARLIRQLLTETALLFVAGGAAGLLLTAWLTRLLLSLLPQLPVPVAVDIAIDWRVILFTIGISAIAVVLAGLAPALQASRGNLVPALKSDGFDGGPARLRLRNAFVVGQVVMSMLLVVSAGLFMRSLQHAADVDPGFSQDRVDVVSLDLSLAGYTEATSRPFITELARRARALPRVQAVTAAMDLPLDGGRMSLGGIKVAGVEPPRGFDSIPIDWNVVEPGFFATLDVPLVRGRDFTDSDTAAAPGVVIVNQAAANRLWPAQDPIGQRIDVADTPLDQAHTMTVVGVAKDARFMSLQDAAEPYIFVPLAQHYVTRVSLLVRTADGRSTIPEIRQIVRGINPNLPVTEAMPLSQVTAIGLVPQRIAATVAGSLGLVGLLLAAIGIYGVTAYAVSRRTREIGIRIALGADAGQVRRFVLRQGLILAGAGVAIGLVIAGLGAQVLRSLLLGVSGLDPLAFGGSAALFATVALIATWLPARRATRVDPLIALKDQ